MKPIQHPVECVRLSPRVLDKVAAEAAQKRYPRPTTRLHPAFASQVKSFPHPLRGVDSTED